MYIDYKIDTDAINVLVNRKFFYVKNRGNTGKLKKVYAFSIKELIKIRIPPPTMNTFNIKKITYFFFKYINFAPCKIYSSK